MRFSFDQNMGVTMRVITIKAVTEEIGMTKIATATVEEITVETVEQEFELTVAELDMVGGGTVSCTNL